MYGPPRDDSPERSVWADETKSRLQEIKKKIDELNAERLQTKLRCNHTYKDGSSAIKRQYDDHFNNWSDGCSVCHTG